MILGFARARRNVWRVGPLAVLALSLAACGGSSYNDDKSVFDGSGTGSGNGGNGGNGSGTWTAGVFQPSSSFINKCSAPRTGTDSITGQPFPDTLGTTTDENNFLRSWTNELYLWY